MATSPRWKMALDVERCIGCHACSVACKVEHNVPLGRFRSKVYYWDEGTWLDGGAPTFTAVPKVKRWFLPTLCMQCEDAPCLKACPHSAIGRGNDGIIRVDADKCEHDGACEAACLYSTIGCDDNDVADKCDFCSNRLAVGMEPACVETCPSEVFHFGDANDPNFKYSGFMEKDGKETTVQKPEEKTKPSVHYRGHKKELVGQRKAARRASGKGRIPNDYSKATIVKGVCLNCSTVCGIQGYVIDGRLVRVGGNPEDPNNGKALCAKGQSGPTINNYPERLLYPLKRVGARGEGKWKRITWDEAYDDIAKRIRKAMDDGKPEEVAIQIGRSRIAEEMTRFLNAIGTPSLFNHRALCSSNKRAANYLSLGETDWESPDFARSKYILNFGANFYEAHQGAIHAAIRIIKGRFDNGAKLVTFDVRLSNTAGRSDEWFAPNPGSDGAIALAMGNIIMQTGEHDAAWLDNWSNINALRLKTRISRYTPEWAEQVSGMPAADTRRVALEFARARPASVAFTNRGSGAHYNAFNDDRAIVLLNAIVGRAMIPAYVTEGIHPRVLAISNTLGNLRHGRAASGINGKWQRLDAWNDTVIAEDQDLDGDIWWDKRKGGTGAGYNVNAILPIQPAPLVGMQGWYDTVCSIRKISHATYSKSRCQRRADTTVGRASFHSRSIP